MPASPDSVADSFDCIVIGAGAAGLFCAMRAGQRGRRVLLLDHADEAGKKILISGGGRCNFTNLGVVPERFHSQNPHFCRSALSRYTQADFIALVDRHRIAWHEKTLGQLFCDGSARQIVAMLLAECSAAGVELRLSQRVTAIERSDRFRVATDRGIAETDAVVLATGGLSIPRMGATGFAFDVARRFGLAVTETRPGLVPLVFAGSDLDFMRALSGVALDVVVGCGRTRFREALLFTHRGLSGPAILQISSVWRESLPITIDLLPDIDLATRLLETKRTRPRLEPRKLLAELMPQRLGQALAERHLPVRPLAEITDKDLQRFAATLKSWTLVPAGSEGYAKAEVTVGGIDTRGLSSRTMQAVAVPGLFAIGEAVDVTGWLGGYNFQWAWSSGWVAGESV
ncbi:MAG: NAD(P)/FAD-dependent oxidoreductase [Alphaproteobacteria bacterium]|nr:NAD(P)/FAD-dependent oxidoreductase [Alphaproteobacteria bacterium]